MPKNYCSCCTSEEGISVILVSSQGWISGLLCWKWLHKRWSGGALSDSSHCWRWGYCCLLPSLHWLSWDHVLVLIYHTCICCWNAEDSRTSFYSLVTFIWNMSWDILRPNTMHLKQYLSRCVLHVGSSELLHIWGILPETFLPQI